MKIAVFRKRLVADVARFLSGPLLRRGSKPNVCIFDVNGVLIDSNLANARAMGEAFSDDPLTPLQHLGWKLDN